MGCATFLEFRTALLLELKSVPAWYLSKLYDSLPQRIANVLELEGGKTKW